LASDEGSEGRPRPAGQSTPGYFKEKPVKVGDEMDVTISEVSRRGDGVTRVQGFVIFIPTGKQGQQARIRVTTIRPNFAIAEIVTTAET
jgi:predicted RNA-binding protein with TRAM domain